MTEHTPAGWYVDGDGNERYFDGVVWTNDVRPQPTRDQAGALAPARPGAFAKLGAAIKQGATDRRAAKEDAARQHAAAAHAAGDIVTSGVFGTSSIEIYRGGYVRVAEGTESHTAAVTITHKTPYERLTSITYTPSEKENASASRGSGIDGAVGSAVASLLKGGKNIVKSSAPGLAAAGIAHIASAGSRTAILTIVTDKSIYSLSNQASNGFIKNSVKGHAEVARALVTAAQSVLGLLAPGQSAVAMVEANAPTTPAVASPAMAGAPSLTQRVRELADLHRDGILSDEEFAAAKAQLLSGL